MNGLIIGVKKILDFWRNLSVGTKILSISFAGFIIFGFAFGRLIANEKKAYVSSFPSQKVLAAQNKQLKGFFNVNVPSYFNDFVNIKSDLSVDGTVTLEGDVFVRGERLEVSSELLAPNVVYSVTEGSGIQISGGQDLVIENAGVTSFQGQTGEVALTAGDNITISGTTISANVPSNDRFSTVSDGTNSFNASGADTVTFLAGTGISLSTNTTEKEITISSTVTGNVSGVGDGLALSSGIASVALLSAQSGTGATSSYSGLEFVGASDQLTLLQGCGNGELLKFNTGTNVWECASDQGGASGIIIVEENDVQVSATAGTLDFAGSDFTLSESPLGEINVAIDYANSEITRNNQNEAISGNWTFSGDVTLSALAAGSGSLLCVDGSNNIVTCTGGGVTSLNSLSGALTIANATTGGSTITIDDASTAQKGIAQFNSTNFTAASGTINTIQNINTAASPTFAGITLSGLNSNGIVHTNGSGVFSTSALNLAGGSSYVTGILPAANGGTGINSSASTGVPSVSSGTWSINATLATSLGGLGANVTAAGAGEILYSTGASAYDSLPAGNGGDCLVSGGAGAPSWTNCAGAAGITTYWDLTSGAITPKNTTVDFLIGSTSTASAKFAILNVNGSRGTQTATLSGSLTLDASGSVQTTLNQTLTIGGGATGNIILSPLGGAGTVLSTGDINLASGKAYYINGASVLNATTLGANVINSSLTSVGTIGTGVWQGTAVASQYGGTGQNFSSSTGVPSLSSGTWSVNATLAPSLGGTGQNFGSSTGVITVNSGTFAASSSLSTALGGLGANVTAAGAGELLYSTGTTTYGHLAAGAGGECLVSGGAGAPTWGSCDDPSAVNVWSILNGTAQLGNTTLDLLVGGVSSASAKFAILGVNDDTPVASLSASGGQAFYLSHDGTLQTSLNQTLSIGGATTGNVNISPSNGNGILNLDLASTNGLYVNGSPGLDISGTAQCVTTTNGIVTGTGVCQLGTEQWVSANGTLYPGIPSLDLLIGGNSTASSKFAFINNAGGTPTASISAGLAGSIYITADGTVTTTANQTITIGGSTSGNITLSPNGGNGTVLSAGNLNLSSGKTFQINGTDVLSSTTLGAAVVNSSLTSVGTLTGGTWNATAISSQYGGTGQNFSSSTGVPSLSSGTWSVNATLGSNLGGTGQDFSGSTGVISVSSGTFSALAQLSTALGGLGANVTAAGAGELLYSTGTTTYGHLAAGAGGECLVSGGAGAPTWSDCASAIGSGASKWSISQGALSPNIPSLDLLLGGATTESAKFAFVNVGSGTPTASISAGLSGAISLTADGQIQTTNEQALSIGGGNSGDIVLGRSNRDIILPGYTGQNGILYAAQTTGILTQATTSTAGLCLVSGASAPTWTNCESAVGSGASKWSISQGALSPNIPSLDLLLGGATTESARFALKGVATDTPVATISASSGYALSLGYDGSISTTLNRTLNIGGNQTGNIVLSPLNGAGNVLINGDLNLVSGNTYQINGTDVLSSTSLGTSVVSSSLTSVGTLTGGTWNATAISSQYGGTGQNFSSSTGVPSLSSGTWSVNATLAPSLGGTGMNTSSSTGIPSISSGTWSVNATLAPSLGGTGQNFGSSTGVITVNSGTFAASSSLSTALGGLGANVTAAGAGELLYSTGTTTYGHLAAGAGGECLVSGGAGAPTWSDCAGATGITTYWDQANGALIPKNTTVDLFVGGTSTSSARFAVLNVNSGVPTASVSAGLAGGMFITSDGTLATTAKQSLTIGNNTTGNINFFSGSNILTSTGNLTLAGTVTANTTNTINGLSINAGTINTGTWNATAISSQYGGTGQNFSSSTGVPSLSSGTWSVNTTLGSNLGGTGQDFSGSTGVISVSSGTFSALAQLSTALGGLGANVTAAGAGELLYSTGTTTYGHLAAGAGGECLVSGGAGAPSWQSCAGATGITTYWSQSLGSLYPNNSTVDFLVGGQASTSAKFAVLNVDSGTPTASVSAGVSGAAYITAAGSLQTTANQSLTIGGVTTGNVLLNPDGGNRVGIGTSNPLSTLDLSGIARITNTGDVTDYFTIDSGNTVTTLTRVTNGGTLGNVTIDSNGTLTAENLTGTSSLTVSAFNTNGGLIYTNGSGLFAQLGTGTTGQCLLSNTGAAPSWGSCDGAGFVNVFEIANGAIRQGNTTLDFLLGGTSTESAKFAVLGINNSRGSQTASLSGSLTLDAAGSIQTTDKNILTIGGSTTGDIYFRPGNNANNLFLRGANVAIGNQDPQASLDVSSASFLSAPVNKIVWGSIGTTMGTLGYDGGSANEIRIGATSNVGLELITNDTVKAYITAAGNFGIGTTAPAAMLEVSGGNTGGNAGFIVNQTGASTNDILAASSSGVTKFVIKNDGTASSSAGFTVDGIGQVQSTRNQTLTIGGGTTGDLYIGRTSQNLFLPNFTTGGGLLYTTSAGLLAQTGAGTGSQCLLGGTTPTWGSCDGASSVNTFEFANGTVRTTNQTTDLLIGGTSTSSAKFAVLNISSGIPTATVSGNFIVMPDNGAGGSLGIGLTNPVYNIDTVVRNGQRGLNVLGTTSTASDSFYGAYNTLSYTGGSGSPGIIAGTRNDLSINAANSANSNIYGTYNTIAMGNDNNRGYGLYNVFDPGANSNTISYGVYNDFGDDTDTNQWGYGLYNLASPASNSTSTKTGVYNEFDNIYQSVGFHNAFTADQTSIDLKGLINDFSNTAAVNGIGFTGIDNNFTTTRGGTYVGIDNTITSTSATSIVYGLRNDLTIGAGGTGGDIYGVYNDITNSGGSTGADVFGVWTQLTTTGSSTPESYGYYVIDSTSTTTGIQYGLYVDLDDADATKNWALYVEDDSAESYFGNNALVWGAGGTSDTSIDRGAAGQLDITGRSTITGGLTGGNAALIVNQNGSTSNDIFTASASGATRFTIANNGDLALYDDADQTDYFTISNSGTVTTLTRVTDGGTLGNVTINSSGTLTAANLAGSSLTIDAFTTNGGLLYTNGSGVFAQLGTGTTGQCLLSNTGAAPSWGSCDGAASVNVFEFANGTARTTNQTVDLLVGGLSSASAKFAVLNVDSGTPVASISSGLNGQGMYISSNGTLQTTNNQTLTIGGDTTGEIYFRPGNNANNLFLRGANVAIGNQNPQASLDVSSSSFISAPVNKIIWGSIGTTMGTLGYDGGSANEIRIGATSNVGLELITNDTVKAYITAAGNFGIGTTAPAAMLEVSGGNTGGNAGFIVNQTGASTNDILAASSSGITKFVIKNDGTASSSAGFTINAAGSLQTTNNNTLTIGGSTTGNVAINPKAGNGTVFINQTSTNPSIALAIGNGNALTANNLGQLTFNPSSGSPSAQFISSTTPIAVNETGTHIQSGHSLATGIRYSGYASYGDYVYLVGGFENSVTSAVYYAKTNPDGTIGPWIQTTSLPAARYANTVVAYKGYLYSLGGHDGGNPQSTVYYTKINSNGTLNPWSSTSSIGAARHSGSAVAYDGYIYFLGGSDSLNAQTNTYYAPVNADGSLGSFSAGTALSVARADGVATAKDGYVYVAGGINSGGTVLNTVHSATLSSGTIGTWNATNTLPAARNYPASAMFDGKWVVTGGSSTIVAGGGQNNIYFGSLNNGVATWTTASSTLASARFRHMTAITNGFIFTFGGEDTGGNRQSTVYSAPLQSTAFAYNTSNSFSQGYLLDLWNNNTRKFAIDFAGNIVASSGAVFKPLVDATDSLGIATANGTQYVNFDSFNQRVGIGTKTPTAKLDVAGTASISGQLSLYGTPTIQSTANQTLTIGGNTTGNIVLDSNTGIVSFADTTINLAAGSTINPVSSGTLSIGTANTSTLSLGTLTTGTTNINGGNINLNGNTNVASGYSFSVVSGTSVITGPNSGTTTTLRVNNHTSTASIFVAQDAAIDVFTIADGGDITATNIFTLPGTRTRGNASLIVGQSGPNDIFTASSSGTTRFTIGNAGQIGLGLSAGVPNFGSSGQCLLSQGVGSGAAWGACDGAGSVNTWEFASGTVRTTNQTTDLLVGGASTESAKFAILNVNGARGTQVASLSGSLTLDAIGAIQTTNNQTLNLGGNTTGNIILNSDGNDFVGIGTANPSYPLDISGTLNGSGSTIGTNINYTHSGTDDGYTYGLRINFDKNGVSSCDYCVGGWGLYLTASASATAHSYEFRGAELRTTYTSDFYDGGNPGGNGIKNTLESAPNEYNLTSLYGINNITSHKGTGNVSDVRGISNVVGIDAGSASSAYGLYNTIGVSTNASVTNYIANYNHFAGLGQTTNIYGLYFETLVGTATNTYGLYLGTLNGTNTYDVAFSNAQNRVIRVLDSTGSGTTGRSLTLQSGAGTLGNAAGGALALNAGSANGTQAGGALSLTAGAGGATGAGGAITITTGTGGATSGASGALTLATGSVTSGNFGTISLNQGSNTRLRIDANGFMGIGTTTPLTSLHVDGSNSKGRAAFIVDQTASSSNDIFTASSSGTTRFTIGNNGNLTATGTLIGLTGLTSSGTITFSGFSTDGGLLYTNGSGVLSQLGTGTTGQCLISNTNAAPSWGACDGAASVNVWNLTNGAIIAGNETADLLVGGTSTESAKFAILGVNNARGQQTASISGNLVLDAAGSLQTTNRQTLNVGGTTTGNIELRPLSGTGSVRIIHGNSSLGGLILQSSEADSSSKVARIKGAHHTNAEEPYTMITGSATVSSNDLFIGGGSAVENAATNIYFYTALNNTTTTGTQRMRINSNGNIVIGNATAQSLLHVSGGTTGGNSALIVDQRGSSTNDIFTASASGVTKFALGNNGELGVVGGGSLSYGNSGDCLKSLGVGSGAQWTSCDAAASVNTFEFGDGTVRTTNQTTDLLVGGTATTSAKFAVLNVNGTGPATATVSGNLIVMPRDGAGGRVGIGTTNPLSQFHIESTPGTTGEAGGYKYALIDVGTTDTSQDNYGMYTLLQPNPGVNTAKVYTGGHFSVITDPASSSDFTQRAVGVQGQTSHRGSGTLTLARGVGGYIFNYTGDITTANASQFGIQNLGTGTISSARGLYIATAVNSGGGTVENNYGIYIDDQSTVGSTSTFNLYSAGSATNNYFAGNVGIGAMASQIPLTSLHVDGSNSKGNAAFILDQTASSSNDIFTASASGATKFVIKNDGTASSSAGFTIDGVGSVQSTNNQTLTLGGDTTGNIRINPRNGTAGGFFAPNVDNVTDLGASTSARFRSLYLGPSSLHIQCTVGDGCGQGLDYSIGINTSTGSFEIGTNSIAGSNTALSLSQGGVLSLGKAGFLNGALVFNSSGIGETAPSIVAEADGDLTLSAPSGFVNIGSGTGDISLDPGASNLVANLSGAGDYLIQDNGATYVTFADNATTTFDFPGTTTTGVTLNANSITSGNGLAIATSTSYGSSPTISGNLLNLNRNITVTSGTVTTTGALASFTDTCTITSGSCTHSANILSLTQNYGRSTGNVLNISNSGNGTGVTITSVSGGQSALIINKTGNNDIFTASSSGTTRFTIGNAGQIGLGLSAGIPNFGSSGQCLLSQGVGSGAAWGSCDGASSVNTFEFANGTIRTTNQTTDLLIGGTSTTSAKFAVLNINSGTPTASVSSGLNGNALSFNASGNIQTARNATLTIGGNTTGDIILSPRNSIDGSYVLPGADDTVSLGSTAFRFKDIFLGPGTLNIVCKTGDGCASDTTYTLGVNTANRNLEIGNGSASLTLSSGGNLSVSGSFASNLGSGQTYTSSFDIRPNISGGSTVAVASVSGATTFAALVADNSGTGDIFTASSSGLTRFVIGQNGNVGIGTSSPSERLHVNGNILIDQATNSTQADEQNWTLRTHSTPGTIVSGGTASVASISASTVFNGSLYIGTSKQGEGEVYRYNGTTGSWTKVSDSTAGTIASGGTSGIDTVSSMVVYNGKLYIGTTDPQGAEVYEYNGGTTWTKISQTTQGTIRSGGTSGIYGAASMVVYGGRLFVGTELGARAELYRWDGGTNWTIINTTAGQFVTTNSVSVHKVSSMAVLNGTLYIGTGKPSAADVLRYNGNTGASVFTKMMNNTSGSFSVNGANVTAVNEVTAMTVYNGRLYIGINKSNAGEVWAYDSNTQNTTANTWHRISNAAGQIDSSYGTNIDTVSSLAVYNGRLYAGTTESNVAEIYRYEGVRDWTRVSQAPAGTIASGGTTGVNGISQLQPYNGSLYAGTNEPTSGEVYSYTLIKDQSNSLIFHAGTEAGGGEQNGLLNIGRMFFMASPSANMTSVGQQGAFFFTHGLQTQAGAYDIAEDYPTRDTDLEPGDLVEIDPNERGYVRRSTGSYANGLVGVYSEKPGFRLSQVDETIDGAPVVPVALAGRVPAKVSTENGDIMPGDYLTSSSTPGVAMKATEGGNVIGKAMEPYSGDGVGKVLVYVNASQTIGDTSAGIFSQSGIGNVGADLNSNFSTFLNVNGDFAGKIKENASGGVTYSTSSTGYAEWYKKAIADDALLNGDIVCLGSEGVIKCADNTNILGVVTDIPAFEGNSEHANEDGYVLVATAGQVKTKVAGEVESSDAIGISETQGVGTKQESGYILGYALESATNSSDSAILVSINPTYKLSALSMGSQLDAPSTAPDPTNLANNDEFDQLVGRVEFTEQILSEAQSSIINLAQNMASLSAQVERLEEQQNLAFAPFDTSSDVVTETQNLLVYGTGSFTDISAVNSLSIGTSLRITSNSIDTVGEALSIQSLRQGELNLMAGALVINTNGQITVSENAVFEKDVTVRGVLSASSISIEKSDYLELSSTVASSSATAGRSSITVGNTFRRINNPNVKESSLIYVTPTSRTYGATPFVSEQSEGQYFIVEIEEAIDNELEFNFLIVN